MSDHPNPNIRRGGATSGRSLLVAFAVIVAIVALLALVGSIGDGNGGDGAPVTPDAITPAQQSPAQPIE